MSGEPLPRPFYGEGRLGEIVLKACASGPKGSYPAPSSCVRSWKRSYIPQTDAAVIYPDGDELTMDTSEFVCFRAICGGIRH